MSSESTKGRDHVEIVSTLGDAFSAILRHKDSQSRCPLLLIGSCSFPEESEQNVLTFASEQSVELQFSLTDASPTLSSPPSVLVEVLPSPVNVLPPPVESPRATWFAMVRDLTFTAVGLLIMHKIRKFEIKDLKPELHLHDWNIDGSIFGSKPKDTPESSKSEEENKKSE